MVTQRDVLTFLAGRTAEGRAVDVSAVCSEFWLSPEAARGHLRRLWQERLIEPIAARPPRFRFRLQAGEAIGQLPFRIAARGRQRLRWYERQEPDEGGLILFR